MSEEQKPRFVWPWIAALLIGLPVLYVASAFPAFWLVQSEILPVPIQEAIWQIYLPVILPLASAGLLPPPSCG